jgi:hypothetical protein
LEWVELGESAKISFIGRHNGKPPPGRAHRQKSIVGKTSLSDLLKTMLGSQASEHFSGESPIVEVGHENPLGSVEVALQSLDDSRVPGLHSRVQLLEDNGAEPNRSPRGESPKLPDSIVTRSQCCDVYRGIEKDRPHLLGQLAIHILDPNAALHKPFIRLDGQLVAFVFGDDGIKGTLDRLGFRFSPQNLLGAPNFDSVKLEVLV